MAKRRLLILALFLVVAWAPFPSANAGGERVVHITAQSYAFTPEVVHVRQGDRMTIVLDSVDSTHGIYLDAYDVSVDAEPGHPAQLTLVADKAGSFRFRCSVACGNLHPFMIGQLKVGPNVRFWRALAAVGVVVTGSVWLYGRRAD